MLPEKSQTSLTKGVWIVHKDGLNTIKIFGSNTGKEEVYLNDVLVSEKRTIKLQNTHQFSDVQGNKYEITFIVTNLIKGELTCQIHKNTEQLKSFNVCYRRGKKFTIKRFLIVILSSVFFSTLSAYFELPKYVFFIFLGTILILHLATRDKGKIIIEENN